MPWKGRLPYSAVRLGRWLKANAWSGDARGIGRRRPRSASPYCEGSRSMLPWRERNDQRSNWNE